VQHRFTLLRIEAFEEIQATDPQFNIHAEYVLLLDVFWLPLLLTLSSDHLTPPAEGGVLYRQPQLAARGDSYVAMAFGSGNQVFFTSSDDGGKSFRAPVLAGGGKGMMYLGRHRGPRVVLTPNAIVISAVLGEKGGWKDGDLYTWRSTDQGRTWSAPVRINDVADAPREGLHSMAAKADGTLFAAWLDQRTKGMKLYGSSSKDEGKTWGANTLVYESPDAHICECCHPSVAFDAEGTPLVMFRNWLQGSRDMYVANTKTGKSMKMGEGTWPLQACPMDGGSLVVDGKRIFAAWRRDGTVYWNEAGKKEVEAGKGKDVAMVLAAGSTAPLLVWNAPDGVRSSTGKLLDPKGGFASLAVSGKSVYVAWESEGGKRIRVEKLQ